MANTHAPADDRAYALYRAINCYAPSGYNECGSADVPKSTRKQWFNTLKAVLSAESVGAVTQVLLVADATRTVCCLARACARCGKNFRVIAH